MAESNIERFPSNRFKRGVTKRIHKPLQLGQPKAEAGTTPGRKMKTAVPKNKVRKALRLYKARVRNALCSPCGPNRPMSGLDEQAVALGIYSDTFHLLNRLDRKSKASTALSAQRQAA